MQPTSHQRYVLGLICDAFTPGDGAQLPSASDMDAPDTVVRLLARNPSTAEQRTFLRLLDIWDTRAFSMLTGNGPRRFSDSTQQERERLLLRLAESRFEPVRGVFQALKTAALTGYYAAPNPAGQHPYWESIGFPPAPGPRPDAPAPRLVPLRPARDTDFDCDVVVVGSGAGGGVAAGVLAEAGLDVMVVERGEYYDDADFGRPEIDGLLNLYAPGPARTAEGQLALVAGTCVGGGTVVNWSTSLRTPDDVRTEWAGLGATQFASAEYSRALDLVSARIGVNVDHSPPSARDTVLERGLRALGWHVDELPRNVRHCDAGIECGRCGLGCRLGAKQSVVKTWLDDAAQAGARLLTGTEVREIELRHGHATGVTGITNGGHRIRIRARAVVAAAGAVQTPALLRRSGLRNENIGRYLRLHPATAVFGVFGEEIRGWEGGMQTRYSAEHRDLDGAGYGVIYETGPMTPAMTVGFTRWTGSAAHRAIMSRFAHSVPVGIITRDRDHGTVGVDRKGNPVVRYRLSAHDTAHVRAGIEGATRILEAAGARQIFTGHQNSTTYDPLRPETRAAFLEDTHRTGYAPGRCAMGALHIMGSARMGGSPDSSATDPDGATWDVPNVVVADGSCFPTASGVNPMVSIEAIAHMNATRLAGRLGR
ncbi:GMC family oxidoreductase N-terminal domain-containing protein [Nocardia niigatensis]|uniref:GMC family oxidoreductase N-terminal domain-containing protein n=1 Tax=Nocardia niigatensis TaxID=209249 RepID=UPI000592B380|nr:GMC family oxidoreductase N-terminal domain-containing protein [Nocardia niigatensis]